MQNIKLAFLLCLIFIAQNSNAGDHLKKKDNSIYICTFNVYRMGAIAPKYISYTDEGDIEAIPWKTPERIQNLANVLAVGKFDLIALQELNEGGQGEWALSDLENELNNHHGCNYSHFVSDDIGRGYGMNESMGFLYNPDLVSPSNVSVSGSLTELIEVDGRDLVRTQWIAGDFDFTLISCHFAWGNEDDRIQQYRLLQEILTTPTPSPFSNDPDIIVLGDFNRFGDDQEAIKQLSYNQNQYFAPNVTFFDPFLTRDKQVSKSDISGKNVPSDNPQLVSTTVSMNTFVYDIIFMTKDCIEEYPGNATIPIYGEDFGIIHYDEKDGFGYQAGVAELNHNELKVAYSDHRPLWLRFKTDTKNSDANSQIIYVGTEYGSKFHLPSCWRIRNRQITHQWTNREDALKERGPCSTCKP